MGCLCGFGELSSRLQQVHKALLAAKQSLPPYNILFTNTDIKTENSMSWLRNLQFKYSRSFFPNRKLACSHMF